MGTATRIVLAVGIAVLVACCAGGALGGLLLRRSVGDQTGPIGTTVAEFLDRLQAGDAAGAYRDLCASTRLRFGEPAFVAYVAARPRLTGHQRVSVNLTPFNGQIRGDVVETLRYADQSSETHRFVVIREAPAWWICGDPY
jgi:hypothetical protein